MLFFFSPLFLRVALCILIPLNTKTWNPRRLNRSQVTLFIDSLEYNAHSTAVELLWAGVLVVTCPSRKMTARVGASLLVAADVVELIAWDDADFASLTLALVGPRFSIFVSASINLSIYLYLIICLYYTILSLFLLFEIFFSLCHALILCGTVRTSNLAATIEGRSPHALRT